jgi:hypothetical protein
MPSDIGVCYVLPSYTLLFMHAVAYLKYAVGVLLQMLLISQHSTGLEEHGNYTYTFD